MVSESFHGFIERTKFPHLIETLMTNLKTLNETICTLHANYISGNKKKMNKMKEHGFWIVDVKPDGSRQCLSTTHRAADSSLALTQKKPRW